MKEYHKIQTVFKRDPLTSYKTLLESEYAIQEFEYLKDNIWVFTEKIDGTNIRVMWDGNKITFGGKTDKAEMPTRLLNKLQERFLSQAQQFAEVFGKETTDICFYGEGYGAGIQKGGGNYRQDQDFVLFDIKIGKWWIKRDEIENISKIFGLDVVPVVGEGTLTEMVEQTRKGFTSRWGDFLAEGIVARPKAELLCRDGSRLITKIKCKDFVMEGEK